LRSSHDSCNVKGQNHGGTRDQCKVVFTNCELGRGSGKAGSRMILSGSGSYISSHHDSCNVRDQFKVVFFWLLSEISCELGRWSGKGEREGGSGMILSGSGSYISGFSGTGSYSLIKPGQLNNWQIVGVHNRTAARLFQAFKRFSKEICM
jgi:hypothetical protein